MAVLRRDRRIDELAASRVAGRAGVGIAAGIVDDSGDTCIGIAGSAGEGQVPLDADTLFEVGSVTKVLTGTLMAAMVARREVALGEPVNDLLPQSVTAPSFNGRPIRLAHLATHTSGLPRMPTNLRPANPANPLADYSVGDLYEFLEQLELTRAPGSEYEYSNAGFGLLGHALALRAGMPFAELLRTVVATPLGLSNTSPELPRSMARRFALPHDERGELVPRFENPVLAAAGGLLSTVADMLRFANANVTEATDPLTQAMREAQEPRYERPDGVRIGLAWHIRRPIDRDICFHSGETDGSRSFIALDPDRRRAVVVLANCAESADDIGLHLLDPRIELTPPRRAEIAISPDTLSTYVGVYDLDDAIQITVTQSPGGLTAEATGIGRAPLHAQSETEFFVQPIKARLRFQLGSGGEVTGVTFNYRGRDLVGTKVSPRTSRP